MSLIQGPPGTGKTQTILNIIANAIIRGKTCLLYTSYLGITGIYFPFYAEANVNVNIPVNELPTTMAHEMAHAKGVSLSLIHI